ncbi:MAG: hypothetical protein II295_00360 [Akkermansia sp.]|nr:hypothetical protein [Akkermansia sp.]
MFNLQKIASLFDIRADYVFGEPYGSGHINDTFRIEVEQAGIRVRYILQRVNSNVFRQPIGLMENVKRVTDEALRVLLEEGCKEAYRRTLTIIPAKDGKPYAQDEEGARAPELRHLLTGGQGVRLHGAARHSRHRRQGCSKPHDTFEPESLVALGIWECEPSGVK